MASSYISAKVNYGLSQWPNALLSSDLFFGYQGKFFYCFLQTNDLIKLVEMYRGEIEGRIGENRNRELEVDDIGKRLQQLNREVIQIRNCFMLVTQYVKPNNLLSFANIFQMSKIRFQMVGLIDRYKAVRQMEKDYQKE